MNKPEISDYTLEACCGSGAYGDVWTAKDRSDISRAVKILDRRRLERLGVLHREEKAIKLFRANVPRHPNLVEIYHVGENDNYIYYVMDLADNVGTAGNYVADTLEGRLGKRPLPASDAKKLISLILDAAECLHLASLVHRDIKPSNIIFVGGVPKLADIGLVRSSASGVSMVGTPGFMPPDGPTGPESDLYSIGKLLYCAITGRTVDKFPSLPEFLEPANLADVKLLNKVVLKACDRDPSNRFSSAAEFRNALQGRIRRRSSARTLAAFAALAAVSTVSIFFTVSGMTKSRTVSRLMDEARLKMQSGDIPGAFRDISSIMKIDQENKDALELMNELTRRKNEEKKRKLSVLLDDARAKRQAGDVSGAVKVTGEIIEIEPENKEARILRNELIREMIAGNPAPASSEEHEMTQPERKEFAMLMLLYNTFMTKGNYVKAAEAIESLEKKWPYLTQRKSIQDFKRKAQEKMSEIRKTADDK